LASGAAGRAGGKEAHKQTQCVSTGQRLIATANLVGKSGSPLLGNALFEQRDGRVQIRVQLQQAPAGRHGVFVYESGDCAGARAENTSAVFNPTRAPAGGPGRIGDIEVGRDGNGELEVQSEQLTVQAGPLSVLFRALVIHAQPAEPLAETPAPGSPRGERATRIGCGVITMRPELLAP
jgi:Cu/Zn superoxide dismutase